jgi:hypothetical protein
MLYNEYAKSLIEQTDFSSASNGGTFVSSGTLVDGQWTFNETTKTARVKKATGATGGGFKVYFDRDLYIGDIVEIQVECRLISGSPFRLSIEEFGQNLFEITSSNEEYEILTFKHVVQRNIPKGNTTSRINIGYYTADGGEYEVRNPVMKVSTKNTQPPIKPINLQKFVVKKDATLGWMIRSDVFASDGGTITILDTNTLKITFTNAFETRPICVCGGEYYGNSYKYRPAAGYADKTFVYIRLVKSDGTFAELSTVEADVYFDVILVA